MRRLAALTLVVSCALSACGQSGPLVHPEDAQRVEAERKERQKRELGGTATPAPAPADPAAPAPPATTPGE